MIILPELLKENNSYQICSKIDLIHLKSPKKTPSKYVLGGEINFRKFSSQESTVCSILKKYSDFCIC